MTLGEAIQATQSLYSKGVQTQDSRLRPRHIYNQLMRARSTLIAQKVDKGQQLSQWDYITLPCVELVIADPNECPGVIQAGCQVLRTKYKLPKLIAGIEGDIFQSVSSLDGQLIIDPTTFATNKYNEGNKYTSKKPQRYIFNDYMWITILKRLQVVQITAPFDNPVEAWLYPSMCEVDHCIDIYEKDFPATNKMMDTIIDMAVQKLIAIFVQMREDKNNDASDNNGPVGGMLHTTPQG